MDLSPCQRNVLWRGKKSPTKAVAKRFGLEEGIVRETLHRIKNREALGGADSLVIYDNGDVEDESGADLGNICDEPGVNCGA